ncbi:MAG: 50S ribosomal protein L24 [Patescibacteria group bacterium]
MKIRKGDKVKILTGKDSGKTGNITKVLPNQGRVVVDGLNMLTKHQRPKKEGEKGTKVKFAAPLETSNVMLICPKCGKSARVGYAGTEKKLRECKKCKGTF